jgi:hypothetical protein
MALIVLAERPIPCKILPITITSRLVAFTHIKLAAINKAKPMYTTGFLQNYLKGPKLEGQTQGQEKIIVIVIGDFGSPNSH